MGRLRLPALVFLALAAPGALAADASPPRGNPLAGRALFIGARPLRAGGPPCGACHAIGGTSAPFAGSMGPELSRSFDGLDAAGVDGLLADLPFPTMTPLFTGHALDPAERADLGAFLLLEADKPPPGGAQVALCAAVLALAFFAASVPAARRVKRPTRAALLARAPEVPPRPRALPPAPPRASPVARAEGGPR